MEAAAKSGECKRAAIRDLYGFIFFTDSGGAANTRARRAFLGMNAEIIYRGASVVPSRLRFWYDHCKRKTQEDFMRTSDAARHYRFSPSR